MAVGGLVKKIVGVAIGLVLIGTMVPIGLIQLANSTTGMQAAGVSPAVITVLTIVVPIVAGVGLIMYFLEEEV
jgi:hypothetical protein